MMNCLRVMLGSALCCFLLNAWALQELGNRGQTTSTEPFFRYIKEKQTLQRAKTNNQPERITPSQAVRRAKDRRPYPYQTEGLSLGLAQTITFSKALLLPSPMCLVANNPASHEWLSVHKTYLEQNKAVCTVIKADGVRDIDQLQQRYENITFIAVPAPYLVEHYKLRHYPAIVTNKGVYAEPPPAAH